MKAAFLLVLFLFSSVYCQCSVSAVDCDGDGFSEYCAPDFANALIAFYDNMGGVDWTSKDNWDLLVDTQDACLTLPYGILCNGGCPSQMVLNDNLVTGSIDYSSDGYTAASLVSFNSINLQGNSISGDLSQLFSLTTPNLNLLLNNNDFSGVLPSLPLTINSLDVSNNAFSDFLEISSLPNLVSLNMANNLFSGDISSTNFVNCPVLNQIDLSHNDFTGELPEGIFLSENSFNEVDLSYNDFSSFPDVDPDTIFLSLDISYQATGISGSIPDDLTITQILNATHNSLGPSFPGYLSTIGVYLDLSFNNFQSPVPASFRIAPTGGSNGVDSFFLENNDFDCPLPLWCSSQFGNGHCEPCLSCTDITPGTVQHNLTTCDPYKNFLIQNPPVPVRATNSTEPEFVTTVYGGSFTDFFNLVPGIYYTFSTCDEEAVNPAKRSNIDGFDSVIILRDPEGNILASNDECSGCSDGHSKINYFHPPYATFSSATLSIFVAISSFKHFSCSQQVSNQRSMALYQYLTYSEVVPSCPVDYKIECIPEYDLELTPVTNSFTIVPSDIDEGSQYCDFVPAINQTYFDCSNRGINYVEQSFYDYSCVTPVVVTSEAPVYSCISEFVVAQYSPYCTPHGCNLNIYDFPILVDESAACPAQEVTTPSYFSAYIGDTVDYHLFYHDENTVTEVVCTVDFNGLRIINILDETEIDTEDLNLFDVSVDYTLDSDDYVITLIVVSTNDYDPKFSQNTLPNIVDTTELNYEKETLRKGGATFHNIDFSPIEEGNYYLMAFANINSNPIYMSIGSPIVYIYTAPDDIGVITK